jgi:alkylhydroperoxidase family enzyme
LDALAKFTASVVENRGRATEESKETFFGAGYNEANMIDVIIVVGDKIISNYLHNLTEFEIDFPIADKI